MELTPDLLIRAYGVGLFPMARSKADDTVYWVDPDERGVLPLDERFHVPRSLRRTVRRGAFDVTVNRDFDGVLAGCAESRDGREDTWINDPIAALCRALYQRGYAHSIECWAEGKLAGGLYGIVLGGAFFGESMFSRARDASKVALVHLVAMLRASGFVLLDTQFTTDHLQRFGAMEVSREAYLEQLRTAIAVPAAFPPKDYSVESVLGQPSTQMS